MKLKKREILYFVILVILTLLCKQTIVEALTNKLGLQVHFNAEYLKLAGFVLNVLTGYIGLIKHEVKWIKVVWLSVYGMLLIIIVANQLTQYAFNYSWAEFDYGLFVSPVFYLVACILPRYVALENVNMNRQKAK
ncbi:hypothetical protein [Mucilaginibacter sp. CSA2-8R]|uniref:hypothetical protein n=1 Tax=Mucilaginibacter sp. CSA2-8R TaxID=3141542 RepID=UPI00315D29FC